jgi:hypothetical protein
MGRYRRGGDRMGNISFKISDRYLKDITEYLNNNFKVGFDSNKTPRNNLGVNSIIEYCDGKENVIVDLVNQTWRGNSFFSIKISQEYKDWKILKKNLDILNSGEKLESIVIGEIA